MDAEHLTETARFCRSCSRRLVTNTTVLLAGSDLELSSLCDACAVASRVSEALQNAIQRSLRLLSVLLSPFTFLAPCVFTD